MKKMPEKWHKKPPAAAKLTAGGFFISFPVGQSRDIIQTYLILFRKQDRDIERDFPLTSLIPGIGRFVHVDDFGDLPLAQIGVLSQIPYSSIWHNDSPVNNMYIDSLHRMV